MVTKWFLAIHEKTLFHLITFRHANRMPDKWLGSMFMTSVKGRFTNNIHMYPD